MGNTNQPVGALSQYLLSKGITPLHISHPQSYRDIPPITTRTTTNRTATNTPITLRTLENLNFKVYEGTLLNITAVDYTAIYAREFEGTR